jgi:hypothetical protein
MALSLPSCVENFQTSSAHAQQLPLIHVVDAAEQEILRNPEATWYHTLRSLDYRPYRKLAAQYYEALYESNREAGTQRRLAESAAEARNSESKTEARQRLLFQRPTAGNSGAPVLFDPGPAPELTTLDPETLAPGKIPERLAGRQPKCFFAMFRAFLGVVFMGRPAEPQAVHEELSNNPVFARVCGFTYPDPGLPYRQTDIPSLRKLEDFDQIMTEHGLWSQCKWDEIRTNIAEEVIQPEPEAVHDTTHYFAHSSFEVVEFPGPNGKPEKKSQSKPTKRCGCAEKETCPHPWELTDEGAGTVVKSSNVMHWGHKASVLALPRQGVPLDAVAVTDAASHDSQTLVPHLERVRQALPELWPFIRTVIDDGAAYDRDLFVQVQQRLGIDLRASVNPRRRAILTENLPRGIDKLTPYGELYCQAGHTLEYRGVRQATETFIYGPPLDDEGQSRCLGCPDQGTCCPRAAHGRHVTISFDLLPHIRPQDPPMAKRYQATMKLRPAVERVIKRLKCDLGDDQLSKRGNATFQARLDKTLLAFHILLRHDT